MNLQNEVLSLFERQLTVWKDAAERYQALKRVRTKTFLFDGFSVRIQFNPARAVSTQAKLDTQSILARPCFLCAKNRPAVQEGIDFKEKYEILVNPFPILPVHFTVASKWHEPQLIAGRIEDMTDLAAALPDFVILYNGAKAGASAPDHFHFQAGNAGFFHQAIEMPAGELITKYSFSSPDKAEIKRRFEQIYSQLQGSEGEEPKMNLFCRQKNGEFVMTVFPRKCHRPSQFFADEKDRIMISPGAIDMSGTMIVSREEDFEKITREIVEDVYRQIS